MRKLLILLVVLLVIVTGFSFAAYNFNSYLQDNREWLAEQASTALGRPISFDEIGLSFRNGLGARLGNLSIGDDPAFAKEDFLKVGRADVLVKLVPLLSGRYEIQQIVLESPEVNIIQSGKGFNFDSLGQSGGKPSQEQTGATAPSTGEALPFLVSVLRIRDGRVHFVDRTAAKPSEMLIEKLDFSADNVGFDTPVSLDIAAAMMGFNEQNFEVDGTVGPLGSPDAAMRAPVDLDVKIGPVVIDRVKKMPVLGESVPPELSSPDPVSVGVGVTGTLGAPTVKIAFDATQAALRYGAVFSKAKGARLSLEADVAQAKDRVDIGSFVLQLAEATLNGGGTIGTGNAMPIDFKVKGAGLPLDGWGRFFAAAEGLHVSGGMDLDVHAQGSMAAGAPALTGTLRLQDVSAKQPGGGIEVSGLTTTVALQGDRVEIPPTDFRVAGEPVNASASVKSLKKLAADFTVSSPSLRLAAIGAGGEGLKQEEVLHGVDVKGSYRDEAGTPRLRAQVRSSGGVLRDIAFTDLSALVGLVNQRASLKQLSLKTFDGSVVGDGAYDLGSSNPAFSFDGKVNGLDVAKLVDFLDLGHLVKMTGTLHGDLELDGKGSEMEQITKAMIGNGSLRVDDGVLKGVNIAESVLSSITGVPGLSALIGPKIRNKYPQLFEMSDTVFEKLGGRVKISGGQADLRDLVLAARDYTLSGDGTLSFENILNLATSFVASEKLTQDLVGSVKEVKYLLDANGRFRIPLRMVGAMPTLRPQPDTQYVTKQLTGALVSTGVEKGLEAIFGKKKEQPAEGDTAGAEKKAEANQQEPVKVEDAAKQILQRGLGELFGGKK